MIRHLQRSTDFELVLRTRSRASSPHFAVHHLAASPVTKRPRAVLPESPNGDLSTGRALGVPQPVDGPFLEAPVAVWFGAVVPKRHARRAVTRTLLKRQIRSVVCEGGESLPRGLWVVRLRAPFDRSLFVSAASDALRRQARAELQQVLASALERLPRQ